MELKGKTVYLIRHCEADGQEPEAELTSIGLLQAKKLADFFRDKKIESIISSPYQRTIQSITPLAKKLNIRITTDKRLTERVLCATPHPNWLVMLENTFWDEELVYEGGESSKEAMKRGVSVLKECLYQNIDNIVIVTHGNLITLILRYFDAEFGFTQWRELSNPDVYELIFLEEKTLIKRLWQREE
ncbi:histidine phosphatase family protein [Niallia sp. 03133]|uniref:histidine phosphatase family protein n=1 Tax=Niallia sp. 03133 TaxID=3458060 RepID=UPI00404434C4